MSTTCVNEEVKKRDASEDDYNPSDGKKKSRRAPLESTRELAAARPANPPDTKPPSHAKAPINNADNRAASKPPATKKSPPRQDPAGTSLEESTAMILPKTQDLDTALHYITQPLVRQEVLSNTNEPVIVHFKIGHASDAARIAALYKQQINSESDSQTSSITTESATRSGPAASLQDCATTRPSLETRLAEGLGDEDTPPCIYALLAVQIKSDQSTVTHTSSGDAQGKGENKDENDNKQLKESAGETKESDNINQDKSTTKSPPLAFTTTSTPDSGILRGAALCRLDWQDGLRNLHVDWMQTDGTWQDRACADFLESRLQLRLLTLSYMTSCHRIVFASRSSKNVKQGAKDAL
jgi:hypothetical protein